MSDSKHTAVWAVIGVVIGLVAFTYNYWFYPASIPRYEILAGPAMVALSFFSEETPFWPKLSIFIAGQYIAYFVSIFLIKKMLFFIRK